MSMNIKNLIADDDAVSPVIGVILMVAITVILAAVIGTFVLGIGQDQQTTPSASFDFEYDSAVPEVVVSHTGGDSFTTENTDSLNVQTTDNGPSSGTVTVATDFDVSSGDVKAGTTATVNGADLDEGDQITVVWTAPGGDKSQSLADFEVP